MKLREVTPTFSHAERRGLRAAGAGLLASGCVAAMLCITLLGFGGGSIADASAQNLPGMESINEPTPTPAPTTIEEIAKATKQARGIPAPRFETDIAGVEQVIRAMLRNPTPTPKGPRWGDYSKTKPHVDEQDEDLVPLDAELVAEVTVAPEPTPAPIPTEQVSTNLLADPDFGGSTYSLTGNVSGILSFSPQYGNERAGTGRTRVEKPFYLFVALRDDAVVVKSGAPRFQKHFAGLTLKYPEQRGRSAYLDGVNNSGMYVMVMPPRAKDERAVMICPRRVDGRSLTPSSYVATDAHFMPYGNAYAQMIASEGRSSRVLARITVSDNINRVCEDAQDQHVSRSAFAQVSCGTQSLPSFDLLPSPPDNNVPLSRVVGGVQVGTELDTLRGRLRIAYTEVEMTVAPMQIKESARMLFQRGAVTLQPGLCYVVVRQTTRTETVAERRVARDLKPSEDGEVSAVMPTPTPWNTGSELWGTPSPERRDPWGSPGRSAEAAAPTAAATKAPLAPVKPTSPDDALPPLFGKAPRPRLGDL